MYRAPKWTFAKIKTTQTFACAWVTIAQSFFNWPLKFLWDNIYKYIALMKSKF